MTRWRASLPLLATAALVALLAPGRALPSVPEETIPTLAPMLERVMPGVVNISTRSRVRMPQNPLFSDPFFRRFFNVPDMPQEQERQNLGSGVVVDAAGGHILTNNHVIAGADEVTVTLRDGRTLNARIVGADAEADVAVIQVEADNLSAVPLANSDALRVGDYVVAIGNPFGLGQTVTSGIVSALGRSGLGIEGYEDFIQTDASINPGNSGGALVNLKGELVGINTAIVGPSGGNVGIGFAIPTNMARSIMGQLIEFGEVRRGKLGVLIQELTPELADMFGIPPGSGVVVSQVVEGGPAAQAGVLAGDVITRINGQPVPSVTALRNAIGLQRVGTEVQVLVLRDGKEQAFKMVVSGEEARVKGAAPADVPALAGATLGPIPNDHPLRGEVEGVAVLQVMADSNAAAAGLRQGDIITAVNRQPVVSVQDVERAAKQGDRGLLIHLRRGNAALFIVIR
ncbi:MAG: DegQ family serine endoprotease [Nitrospirae bacterium]|nr:DegQ family serine endoprotease [Nitrospirota bacterium]